MISLTLAFIPNQICGVCSYLTLFLLLDLIKADHKKDIKTYLTKESNCTSATGRTTAANTENHDLYIFWL